MKTKIVMLPTDKADNSLLLLNLRGGKNLEYHKDKFFTQDYLQSIGLKSFHLYLIDPNAEIKEGSYYISNQAIRKCVRISDSKNYPYIHLNSKKEEIGDFHTWSGNVLATTHKGKNIDNVDINLPQLSEQSIKLLVDYYNKNNKMPDEVEVENAYYDWDDETRTKDRLYNLTNSQGEVDITIPEEKMYSEEEVRILLQDMHLDIVEGNYSKGLMQWMKDKNL